MIKTTLFILFSFISVASKSQSSPIDIYQIGFEKHYISYYERKPVKMLVMYSFGITDGLPSELGVTKLQVIH